MVYHRPAAYSYYRARARAGRRGHGWGERAHHGLETARRTEGVKISFPKQNDFFWKPCPPLGRGPRASRGRARD